MPTSQCIVEYVRPVAQFPIYQHPSIQNGNGEGRGVGPLNMSQSVSHSVVSDSLWPHGL